MEIEDKVRHRRIQAFGVGRVIEISGFGTLLVDFGRSGKMWVSETALELATHNQDALNASSPRSDSVSREPQLPALNVKEGWLVEHNEYGWGEVLAREGPNVLIGFKIGEKTLNYEGLLGHLLHYDDHPARHDSRRVPYRECPTGGGWTPGPKWARHQFGTPNTNRWRKF